MHTSESDLAVWRTVHTEEFLKIRILAKLQKNSKILKPDCQRPTRWVRIMKNNIVQSSALLSRFATVCCAIQTWITTDLQFLVSTVLISNAACTSKPASDYRSAVLQTWMPKNQQCCRPAWLKIDSDALFLTNPKCQRPFFATEKYWT